METYQKIDTLYKRYQFKGDECPNQKWLKFRNKIILGEFSNIEAKYLFDNLWEAYSKIDGTNSKIAFYPSTGVIKVGGKSDNATSQHGQFEMLQEIADRIHPMLHAMFPKETARFTQVKDKETNKIEYWDMADPLGITKINPSKDGQYIVGLEEVPVYIYGEYFGTGIQKGGGRYIQNGNGFLVFDIRQQGCLADVADGKRNDGNARHEENPLHLRDGRILLRHLARDEQVDHPRQHTQQGERDAQQVVTARARLPAHEHHQRSTRNGQQHTDGLHARDALA